MKSTGIDKIGKEEGNKMITEFMGYPFYMPKCSRFSGGPINGESEYLGDIYSKYDKFYGLSVFYKSSDGLNMVRGYDDIIMNPRYHTSLDWLHPVVQSIGKIRDHGLSEFMIFHAPTPTIFDDISVIYEWCVKVITWINQNKTT